MNLRRISVVVTILVSFAEAACGSATGAVVFWLSLYTAAFNNISVDEEGRKLERRWM